MRARHVTAYFRNTTCHWHVKWIPSAVALKLYVIVLCALDLPTIVTLGDHGVMSLWLCLTQFKLHVHVTFDVGDIL